MKFDSIRRCDRKHWGAINGEHGNGSDADLHVIGELMGETRNHNKARGESQSIENWKDRIRCLVHAINGLPWDVMSWLVVLPNTTGRIHADLKGHCGDKCRNYKQKCFAPRMPNPCLYLIGTYCKS